MLLFLPMRSLRRFLTMVFLVETAKVHYGTSLSNVDWLHGGAESLLTLTNLFIVLGLRDALRKDKDGEQEEKEPSN